MYIDGDVVSRYFMYMSDIQTPQVTIDLQASIPVAEQIADGLRVLLVRGELKAGDRLPSSRRLATDLAVHFTTVAEAYRQLEAEGWLELQRRRGTRVVTPPRRRAGRRERADLLASFAGELERMLARYRTRGLPAADLQACAEQLLARYQES